MPYTPPRLSLLALLLIAVLASACASTPKVGVRSSFEGSRVQQIAVVPFYSTSRFSLPPDEMEQIREYYEAEAVRLLREQGFRVIPPEDFRASLESADAAQAFWDGVEFNRSLERYFEPAASPELSLEVETVRRLAAAGKLPASTLLFGEIVYQSSGRCTVDPREHNQHARVVSPASKEGEARPGPCIVSHFEAKLVDARSGETMWHNRLLTELRVPEPGAEERQANIVDTVSGTLGGPHGLQGLRRATSQEVAEHQ